MPKYLIPVTKPFAATPDLGEPLDVGHYYQSPVSRKIELDLITRSGSNTGNFVFVESVIKQLGPGNVAHLLDVAARDAGYIREHFDRVVIPSSNFIATRSSGALEKIVNQLKAWKLPFVFVGLGSQLDSRRKIGRELANALHFVSHNSESIGVRGNYTAEFLHDHGIDNVDVIGCPSAFWRLTEEFDIKVEPALPAGNVLINAEINTRAIRFLIGKIRQNDRTIMQNEPLFFTDPETGILDHAMVRKRFGFFTRLTEEEFKKYSRVYYRQSKIFYNLRDWMAFTRKFVFSCGPRFHGNMVALQAGIPALWLTHDSRTSELTEYLGLPSMSDKDAAGLSLNEMYSGLSLDRFKAGFREKYNSYRAFLDRNHVRHLL